MVITFKSDPENAIKLISLSKIFKIYIYSRNKQNFVGTGIYKEAELSEKSLSNKDWKNSTTALNYSSTTTQKLWFPVKL